MGERKGTYVYLWLIHVDVWWKPQYGKAVILQLKKIVVAHSLSCSAACGVFLYQGSKPYFLYYW